MCGESLCVMRSPLTTCTMADTKILTQNKRSGLAPTNNELLGKNMIVYSTHVSVVKPMAPISVPDAVLTWGGLVYFPGPNLN